MTDTQADDFWAYAIEIYSVPAIRDICLQLQDDFNLEINFLLFCLWSGAHGYGVLPQARIEAAMRHLAPWRNNVVLPLRLARRAAAASDVPEGRALKDKILEIEISSEKVAQQLIIETALAERPAEGGPSVMAAKTNLYLYCHLVGVDKDTDAMALINVLQDLVLGVGD